MINGKLLWIIVVCSALYFPISCKAPTATSEQLNRSGLAKIAFRKEISQYGITWFFDKPAKTGQFITGD